MIRVWVMCGLFLVSALSMSIAQDQSAFSYNLRKTVSPVRIQANVSTPQTSIRILAIMIEFKTDDDVRTTGNGKFLSDSTAVPEIDPPPHDSTYFKNKLRFVKNYFRKVSNGLLTITDSVYGQSKRITLSKYMSDYFTPTDVNDKTKLVELVKESWVKADSLYPEIDFAQFDAFVIFHAGVGRDIDFISSLGLNPTPYDIPSLYLDSASIAHALGSNIVVDSGRVIIKNTIVLPETESRELSLSSGNFTLQYSINGLFVASVGNYLGLPDLFDTKTGRSGIGQFGLMDGAGIFAYSGLFPPEPSAWEKMKLGWVSPITIQNTRETLVVPAVGVTHTGQDTIYKIPISNSEYFLVENRNRNPEGTGLDLTIAQATGDVTRHFNQDTTGFHYLDVKEINGSVVDVSNFDWAIIGMTDTTNRYMYDGGGILIWHIDENVIQAGLESNAVNADPEHRGVDLEEADGSQDIGHKYEMFTAGSVAENGSPLDCWFKDNPADPNKNIFNRHSFPNSNSYSGAASLITMKDFSARSPRMTTIVEIGDPLLLLRDSVLNLAMKEKFTGVSSFPTSTGNQLYFPTNNGIFQLQTNGQNLVRDTAGIVPTTTNMGEVAVHRLPGSVLVVGVQDSILKVFKLDSLYGSNPFYRMSGLSRTFGKRFTTYPCFAQLDSLSILVGAESGTLYQFNVSGDTISTRSVGNESVTSIALLPTLLSSKPEEYFFTSGNYIYGEQRPAADLRPSLNSWMLAAAVSPKGNYVVAAEKNGSMVISYDQSLSHKLFEVNVQGFAINELAIADLDGDGEKDVIVQATKYVSVLNRVGALLDGFPIQTRGNYEFTGTPLIVDFNGDNKLEIVLLTNDGELWVYDRIGKLLSGFPVQVTSSGKSYLVAYRNPSDTLGIAILSENGSFDAFLTSSKVTATSLVWWQHLGDERHRNAEWTKTTSSPLSPEFLPKSRVYNWPNPVYTRSTQIRYYTSEDADITVMILDLSGVKITELKGKGVRGMDNEITWDVSNIQSGVYLARVEARGSARSEVAFIKIAVVK